MTFVSMCVEHFLDSIKQNVFSFSAFIFTKYDKGMNLEVGYIYMSDQHKGFIQRMQFENGNTKIQKM